MQKYEEPTHAHPGGEARFTPAQAIYDILSSTGYVKSKRGFARLLNLNEGNVYSYLTDPRPRNKLEETGRGQNQARISARSETIHGWCWVISSITGLSLEIHLKPDRRFDLFVSGVDSEQRQIRPMRYRTVYHEYDFSEPVGWERKETAARQWVEQTLLAREALDDRRRKNHLLAAARLAQRLATLGEDLPEVPAASSPVLPLPTVALTQASPRAGTQA